MATFTRSDLALMFREEDTEITFEEWLEENYFFPTVNGTYTDDQDAAIDEQRVALRRDRIENPQTDDDDISYHDEWANGTSFEDDDETVFEDDSVFA